MDGWINGGRENKLHAHSHSHTTHTNRRDAEALKAYMASGKTQEDFIRAIEAPAAGDVIEAEIAKIAQGKAFLPERYFSFGLCKVRTTEWMDG